MSLLMFVTYLAVGLVAAGFTVALFPPRPGYKPPVQACILALMTCTVFWPMLVFTGSGPIEAPAEMADHILDVGFVTEKEKHEAMTGAVAFCHPSTNESLGIVLLESWLAGTPAVVHAGSDVLRFQCRHSGGGLWFRDYAEFEEELLLLLGDPALCRTLAASGRRYVLETYAWNKVEQRLFEAVDRRLEYWSNGNDEPLPAKCTK